MNRGTDSILSVYSDARAEYTKQLCIFLIPAYFQFFIDLLEKAKQNSPDSKKVLWQFQTYLNEIHDWNMEKVSNEISTIFTNCGCDYLEDLLTAVFIAHTKVLTAIRLSSNNKKVQITVPKIEHFLFKVLCESSKLLWGSTFLFRDGIPSIEKQQNYRNIEQILNEGVMQAIRSLMPVKSLLKDFVNSENEVGDDKEESDDEGPSEQNTLEETKDILPVENKIMNEVKEEIPQLVENTPIENSYQEITNNIPNENVEAERVDSEHVESEIAKEPPMIIIEEKPNVQFGDYDTILDSDNPDNSEMISAKFDETPDLEIMDEEGMPLTEGFDELEEEMDNLDIGDYEELI
jgi:hypothetical protein